MRFLVLVKATKDSEAGVMPGPELLAAMGAYNESLIKAGLLLDGAGLKPSSKGARVRFSGASRSVIDGPFAETKELVAGYWLLKADSLREVVDWITRAPNPHPEETEIEIRELYEEEDFA